MLEVKRGRRARGRKPQSRNAAMPQMHRWRANAWRRGGPVAVSAASSHLAKAEEVEG